MSELWPWLTLIGLGVYHGINPGMGWLFAVALGLQEGRRSAVLRALPPIALGHELSIALVVLLVSGLQIVTAPDVLRLSGAVALIAFGAFKLLRPRVHPKWVGMRVNARDLTVWSFLMSSAHGAGLMLFPVLLGLGAGRSGDEQAQTASAGERLTFAGAAQDVAVIALHTAAMFVVMGAVAVLIYEKLGVTILRRAWVNLDTIWAVTVIAAGILTVLA